jgi:hypothetical protein
MTGNRPWTLALTGDLLIVVAFPFLGAANHENSVTIEGFVRTVVPFVIAWVSVGVVTPALRVSTIRSVKRTYRWVPPAWLAAGVIAIALRVFVFDHAFVLSFAIVAIAVVGLLIIGWRLALAVVLRTR